jgi:hypothetical protein
MALCMRRLTPRLQICVPFGLTATCPACQNIAVCVGEVEDTITSEKKTNAPVLVKNTFLALRSSVK